MKSGSVSADKSGNIAPIVRASKAAATTIKIVNKIKAMRRRVLKISQSG